MRGTRVAQDAGSCCRRLLLAVMLLSLPAAAQEPVAAVADSAGTAPADTLAAAAADSVPVALQLPEVRDFFDTGISGTAAVLMTPIFPGWGQLHAGNSWRAMLSFGGQWYFWANMLARDRQAVRSREFARTLPQNDPSGARALYDYNADENWEQVRDYAWWSGAVLLIVALDSYVGAGLYGFDEEPVPVPSRFDEYFDTALPEPPGSRGEPQVVIWQWSQRF